MRTSTRDLPRTMRTWSVGAGAGDGPRLVLGERPVPRPGPAEVLVRVRACGVCRTDLHLADHDLAPHQPSCVPGHEVVGEVVALGDATGLLALGDRVGIAWLRQTCGACRWCLAGAENLCPAARFTGWDADGGFAEHAVVDERFAYRLPDAFDDVAVAPLLCSGIIGFRALARARLPERGRLGIYGFGASAHLTAQIAIAQGAEVHVMTRDRRAQELARSLGAASAGGAADPPPVPLDSAILFAPVGELVPVALEALDQGGTLAVAGIHLTDLPVMSYQRHLFRERTLTSVTANTRADGRLLLDLADRLAIRPTVTAYPFDRADDALEDLAADRVTGAAVLVL